MNLEKLFSFAQLERFGTYDYSVPIGWLMEDPEARRPHVWWYADKPGSMFGRPLKWAAAGRLALRMMRRAGNPELFDYLSVWKFVHPAKPLDAFGESLCQAWLREHPEMHSALAWNLDHLEIPLPSFIIPLEQAA